MRRSRLFGAIALVALSIAVAPPAHGQREAEPATCTLTAAADGTMAGACAILGIENAVLRLHEGGDGGTPIWFGAIEQDGRGFDVDLKWIEFADGRKLALRTPLGWFPAELQREGESLMLTVESEEMPPSATDLRIIERAREILADEQLWDRADDRVCEPDDVTFSLYCAMHRATVDVAGEFHHRQPALQAVRLVVQEQWSHRYTNHRLMNFNNHADTTLADVQATLAAATERVRNRIPGRDAR